MNFSQFPGQTETVSRLIRSVKEERVSHAQLFTGPEGCGSLPLAIAYARYVSCENRSAADSCGTCRSCIKYEKMIHPDLHFVFPVIKNKRDSEPVSDSYMPEWREFVRKTPFFSLNNWLDSIEVGNAQGLIFASEAAEIIKKLNLKTYESDFKVMIIWMPEKMHPAAANKLLKMIEEPPEKTLFLLVSDEPDKILPTIVSRCQIVRIPAFRIDEVSKYLVSALGAGQEKADEIARVSNGNMIRASELFANEESSLVSLENFKKLMRFAWKRDIISEIAWSEEMASIGREAQKSFLLYSLRILRENLMMSMDQVKNNLVFLAGEEASFCENFHPFIKPDNIYDLTSEFSLAHSHIEANGNARIIFLDLALKVTKLIR
jgi:DNA polymerase-3 subunit delta'